MRLTPAQQTAILDCAHRHFGDDAHIWLFGSRVDDRKRGGDIDLLVESNETDVTALMDHKIHFLVDLQRRIGEQKIDVVLSYPGQRQPPPIVAIARDTGVPLQ